MKKTILPYTACIILMSLLLCHAAGGQAETSDSGTSEGTDYRVIIGTFLGNEKRNYYGNRAPDTLEVIWKHYLGKGETVISR